MSFSIFCKSGRKYNMLGHEKTPSVWINFFCFIFLLFLSFFFLVFDFFEAVDASSPFPRLSFELPGLSWFSRKEFFRGIVNFPSALPLLAIKFGFTSAFLDPDFLLSLSLSSEQPKLLALLLLILSS